jgi:hypothetical protein
MVSKDTVNFAAKDLLKKIGKGKTSREYCNQEIVFRQAMRLTRCSTSRTAM